MLRDRSARVGVLPHVRATRTSSGDVGVPTQLLLYAGFGHPITKPKSNRAVLQHNLDWFSHYVFGEPIPDDSPLHGSGVK